MVDIISKEPLTSAELKQELNKMKKRDGELNFRAAKVETYINEILQLKPKEALALKKELQELNIPRLKDNHITKLVDTLPQSPEEVASVLDGYPITINKENLKKISETILKYYNIKESKSKKSNKKK